MAYEYDYNYDPMEQLMEDYYLRKSSANLYMCRDKNAAIPTELILPSYSDGNFNTPQTLYIAAGKKLNKKGFVKDAFYGYSDALIRWYGYDKNLMACNAVNKTLPVWSPIALEQYLRALTDDPELELVHIQAGVNHHSMSPYQIYGYILSKVGGKA